jgi:hypothetical protein
MSMRMTIEMHREGELEVVQRVSGTALHDGAGAIGARVVLPAP